MKTSKGYLKRGALPGVATAIVLMLANTCMAGPYTLFDVEALPGYTTGVAWQADGPTGQVLVNSSKVGYVRAGMWDWTNGTQDLGYLESAGDSTYFQRMNDARQAIGYCMPAIGKSYTFGPPRAAVWDADNGIQVLPVLNSPVKISPAFYSMPADINSAGYVVGFCYNASYFPRAVLWSPDTAAKAMTVTELGTLGGYGSYALGINDAGQVVGYSYTATTALHAFLWKADGGMEDLGVYPGDVGSYAHAINNAGQIVGVGGNGSQVRVLFWDSSKVAAPVDIGTLGGPSIWVLDPSHVSGRPLNQSGQVAGTGYTGVGSIVHAFAWDMDNGIRDLGALTAADSSTGLHINELGQVVGYNTPVSGQQHAMLWNVGAAKDVEMIDLNSYIVGSGWTLNQALHINNDQDIVGTATLGAETKGFLLQRARHNLHVAVEGLGNVDPSPGDHAIVEGTTVTLTATPLPGWNFAGWQGDATGTTSPITITMDGSKSVTAVFECSLPGSGIAVTLTTSASGSGTVTPAGTTVYLSGTDVQLYAEPSPGWQFTGWSGDASGSTNPLSLKLEQDTSVTGVFTLTGVECPLPQGAASSTAGIWVLLAVAAPLLGAAVILRRKRRVRS